MIAQLKNALSKARHNSRYLWYIWQNVDVIRDHFPNLHNVRQRFLQKLPLWMYDGFETGSVNVAWRKGICLAPLGWTMAAHLHGCDLSPVYESHKLFSTSKKGE